MAFVYHIELAHVCNLTCTYCSLTFSRRPRGFMSETTFRKVVAHVERLSPLNLVLLHHFGEPLLHPEMDDFLGIAARAGINPGFSTNGALLTRERFEELVEAGLKFVCITFHEPAGEKAFHELADVARDLGVVLWGRELTDREETHDPNAIRGYGIERQLKHTFAGTVGEEVRRPPGWTPPCDFLDRNFVCVLYDGRVVPCSMDENAEAVLGTVDDLDAIEQRAGYELCRTCRGSTFYEGFRHIMAEEVSQPSPRVDTTGWAPDLPSDLPPGAWRNGNG